MIPRMQFDIRWKDLARGLSFFFLQRPKDPRAGGFLDESAIPCLSARSGLDLLLSTLSLPPGSEILVSALTIPDMPRILRAHGLVPVPVDLDFASAAMDEASLRRALGPRTKAILVAHLFGSRPAMDSLFGIASQNHLFVIEDCAQAFVGPGFQGDPRSDAILHSFGPIKTATSLGGGSLRIRDPALRRRAQELHETWAMQPTREHLFRIFRFGFFKMLLSPAIYPCLIRWIRRTGRDHDQVITGAARSFRSGDFFERIRRRPCRPLHRLLHHRIETFPSSLLEARTAKARRILNGLPAEHILGSTAANHTHWVIPLVLPDPESCRLRLLEEGFDAARAASSLMPVPCPDHLPEAEARVTIDAHRGILYLPFGPAMSDADCDKLNSLLRSWFAGIEAGDS
jgi:perosamine synthetase